MYTGLIGRSAADDQGNEAGDLGDADQADLGLPKTVRRAADSYDYYDDRASVLLKRLQNGVDVGVEKRRFCRRNYVYNPVSGRCQASLLVSMSLKSRLQYTRCSAVRTLTVHSIVCL